MCDFGTFQKFLEKCWFCAPHLELKFEGQTPFFYQIVAARLLIISAPLPRGRAVRFGLD